MNDQKIIELFWERHESAISVTAEKYGKYCHTIAYNILFNHFDNALTILTLAPGTVSPRKSPAT